MAIADITLLRSDLSRWQMTDGGGHLVVDPSPAVVSTAVVAVRAALALAGC